MFTSKLISVLMLMLMMLWTVLIFMLVLVFVFVFTFKCLYVSMQYSLSACLFANSETALIIFQRRE